MRQLKYNEEQYKKATRSKSSKGLILTEIKLNGKIYALHLADVLIEKAQQIVLLLIRYWSGSSNCFPSLQPISDRQYVSSSEVGCIKVVLHWRGPSHGVPVPLFPWNKLLCSLLLRVKISISHFPKNCLCLPVSFTFRPLFPCSPEMITPVPMFSQTPARASFTLSTIFTNLFISSTCMYNMRKGSKLHFLT